MTEPLIAATKRKCRIADVSMPEAIRRQLFLWQPTPTTRFVDELDRALAEIVRNEKAYRELVKLLPAIRKALKHMRQAELRRRPLSGRRRAKVN
jgi:hypothetical protein